MLCSACNLFTPVYVCVCIPYLSLPPCSNHIILTCILNAAYIGYIHLFGYNDAIILCVLFQKFTVDTSSALTSSLFRILKSVNGNPFISSQSDLGQQIVQCWALWILFPLFRLCWLHVQKSHDSPCTMRQIMMSTVFNTHSDIPHSRRVALRWLSHDLFPIRTQDVCSLSFTNKRCNNIVLGVQCV